MTLSLRAPALGAVALLLASVPAPASEIPMMKEGGVYTLPVTLNDAVTLYFIVDTGAAGVLIHEEAAERLERTGTVGEADRLPPGYALIADGTVMKNPRLKVRSVQVGPYKIENVAVAVGPAGTPLLLGQSVLEKLPPWTIDTRNRLFLIEDPLPLAPAGPEKPSPAPSPVSLQGKEHDRLPEDWSVLRRMGRRYLEAGDYPRAEVCLEKALKLQEADRGVRDPGLPETASLLIRAYEAQGKQAEADSVNDWAAAVWGG